MNLPIKDEIHKKIPNIEDPFTVLNTLSDLKNEIFTFDPKFCFLNVEKGQKSEASVKSTSNDLEPFTKYCLELFNGEWNVLKRISNQHCSNSSGDTFFSYEDIAKKRFDANPNTVTENTFFIFCKFQMLWLELGIAEPLFFSLQLVDISNRKQLSENFFFPHSSFLISNEFYESFDIKKEFLAKETLKPRAIFSLSEAPSTNVHMLLKVFKSGQG